jgi:hypothetical protein
MDERPRDTDGTIHDVEYVVKFYSGVERQYTASDLMRLAGTVEGRTQVMSCTPVGVRR